MAVEGGRIEKVGERKEVEGGRIEKVGERKEFDQDGRGLVVSTRVSLESRRNSSSRSPRNCRQHARSELCGLYRGRSRGRIPDQVLRGLWWEESGRAPWRPVLRRDLRLRLRLGHARSTISGRTSESAGPARQAPA